MSAATADDETAYKALTEKIARDRGFHCGSYKERCVRRRIAVRMRAKGVHTYADYARALDADPREYEKLLDALTINVTKLFRNPEAFAALERLVVPALWGSPEPALRVWSAGCASGEEVYSLAALFHRHAERQHEAPAAARRVRILGTDIDRESLDRAAAGVYAAGAFADAPGDLRARYFSPGFPSTVSPELRALVAFERRDLLREPAPDGPHQLVVCRNVVIYFDRPTQEALFVRFHSALAPGGYRVLGTVETLLGPARAMFAAVDARERIFRRL